MPPLTDRELIAAVASFLLPALIAVVQQPTWSSRTRSLVSYLIVFVWTILALFFTQQQGTLGDWRDWLRLFMGTAVVTFGSYMTFWKGTGLVQRIEGLTSPTSVPQIDVLAEADRKASPPRDREG